MFTSKCLDNIYNLFKLFSISRVHTLLLCFMYYCPILVYSSFCAISGGTKLTKQQHITHIIFKSCDIDN